MNFLRTRSCSVVSFSALFLTAGFAFGQHSSKVSHDTFAAASDAVPVIIQYDHDPSDADGNAVEGKHQAAGGALCGLQMSTQAALARWSGFPSLSSYSQIVFP